ncbi:Fc.00g046980.m01.CDS01 [Cosmosporella sp. VM-42]
MPPMREVKTCDRCRQFKRRCDLLKPSCTRCLQAAVHCSFDVAGATAAAAAEAGASAALSTTSTSIPIVTSTPAPNAVVSTPSQTNLAVNPSLGGPISPSISTNSSESLPGGAAIVVPIATVAPGLSNVDPPAVSQRIVRKRKRNCLSCLRCHRLKVKCDKELPCGRCNSSGNGRDCYYSYNKGPNEGKFACPTAPIPPPGDNAKATTATWHVTHKVRGSSHWRDLMTKIGTLTSMDATPLAAALENVATNACLANFSLPGNFPFGTPGATKYFARDAVTRLVEAERASVQDYIDRYVGLLECVNPVLDLPQFYREIEQYWKDPNVVSLCWLSLFLMVLGLGCFATAEEPHQATELMMAAEACLMQTPFMFRPTLLSLRALTLMTVAKQVCNATCWAVDSCWSLIGLLVRTAFIFGLPQEKAEEGGELKDIAERDTRRKLWITILYLDIKVSMASGMPPLTRSDELESLKHMPEWGQPDTLHMVLYQSLPTVLTVLGHLNSQNNQIPYPDVLRYNTQLRELMQHARRVCSGQLQRITVDIFLRRCLMVLHRPYALHPEGPVMFPESYWSSLECSLALLIHYRELWSADNDQRLDLVGRAFVLDFFSAALTASVHVLRKDAPLAGAAAMGCEIPPRQIILETLTSCVDIWSGEKEKSVCYRTGYKLLLAVLDILPKLSEPET